MASDCLLPAGINRWCLTSGVQNKRFWSLIDNAIARGKKEGFIDLKDLQ